MQAETPKLTFFKFQSGAFSPRALDQFPSLSEDEMFNGLRKSGYLKEQVFGDTNGVSFELYSSTLEPGKWLVLFQTSGAFCPITCESWPDLITLLALLSPIALAGALQYSHNDAAYLLTKTLDTGTRSLKQDIEEKH
jgi:hypothetical protein